VAADAPSVTVAGRHVRGAARAWGVTARCLCHRCACCSSAASPSRGSLSSVLPTRLPRAAGRIFEDSNQQIA
jgi:hypothetical protein